MFSSFHEIKSTNFYKICKKHSHCIYKFNCFKDISFITITLNSTTYICHLAWKKYIMPSSHNSLCICSEPHRTTSGPCRPTSRTCPCTPLGVSWHTVSEGNRLRPCPRPKGEVQSAWVWTSFPSKNGTLQRNEDPLREALAACSGCSCEIAGESYDVRR